MIRLFSAAIVLLMATACTSDGTLAHDVEYCCGPPGTALSTYSLALLGLPAFLAPPLRAELVAALTARGLRPDDENPDALITLRYSEAYADSERPLPDDGFGDPLAHGGQRKFDARVTVEIRRASDGAQVLRGVLSREHTVSVGQYNHEKAAPMIRTGFDVLLRRLPQATSKRVSKA